MYLKIKSVSELRLQDPYYYSHPKQRIYKFMIRNPQDQKVCLFQTMLVQFTLVYIMQPFDLKN